MKVILFRFYASMEVLEVLRLCLKSGIGQVEVGLY